MARKYGASDLGSEWVTVPRNFRGRKPTSSPTTLAYITAPERGLLKKYALMKTGKDQVGPEGIPSYDDSGFGDPKTRKLGTYTPGTYNFGRAGDGFVPTRTLDDIRKDLKKNMANQSPGSKAVKDAKAKTKPSGYPKDIHPPKPSGYPKEKPKDKDQGGGDACPRGQKRIGGICRRVQDEPSGHPTEKPKDKDPGPGENKCEGVMHKGICHTRCEDTHGEEYTGTYPHCVLKSTGESVGGNGKGSPSLNTILQPDQTPMLQTLTDEMDLRNMLGSVLNKNNPLFKQARTRALQAMAARGVVNSTMAEESVMSAIMNVAMPIATRVIDDFQRVMAANVNATNAFKAALNQAYYQELISRVDAANTWNLNSMAESSANWRERFGAFTGAKDIEDKDAFERYMAMITGSTKSKDWTAPTFP